MNPSIDQVDQTECQRLTHANSTHRSRSGSHSHTGAELKEFSRNKKMIHSSDSSYEKKILAITRIRSRTATGSENENLKNSGIYNAPPYRSQRFPSLSSVSANSQHKSEEYVHVEEEKTEKLVEQTWMMIDEEITEWRQKHQAVAQAQWWSKYAPHHKVQDSFEGDFLSDRERVMDSTDCDIDSSRHRRAMSENVAAGRDSLQDRASLIALQLLGACYTLPPTKMKAARAASLTQSRPKNVPSTEMISSLKMHSQFRDSPSFGHQARNPSPASFLDSQADAHPIHGNSKFDSPADSIRSNTKRGRGRRCLNNKEMFRRNSEELEEHIVLNPYENSIHTEKDSQPHPADHIKVPMNKKTSTTNANYSLHAVIRSEPHHVFIQPVKELVVKGWKQCRRRFEGSLHSPLPDVSGEYRSADSSSMASSPAISSDGMRRRRRAQERGEIYSSADQSLEDLTLSKQEQVTSENSFNANGTEKQSSKQSLVHESPVSVSPASVPKRSRRRGRKSMLSEVCTPNDFCENIGGDSKRDLDPTRPVLDIITQELTATPETGSPTTPTGNRIEVAEGHTPGSLEDNASDTLGASRADNMLLTVKEQRPAAPTRRSTSGTQIFHGEFGSLDDLDIE